MLMIRRDMTRTLPDNDMNQIEARIARLVHVVRTEGAYCCILESVIEMDEKPTTVRVTMRCKYHHTYSFEVHHGGVGREIEEEHDSVLMQRIALGIITNMR